MPALKLGISLAALRLSFKKALPWLAERSVDCVELDARTDFPPQQFGSSAIRELRKHLDDHRLRAGLVSFPTRRGFTTEVELERRLAGVRAAMKFAHDVGARYLSTTIGLIPDDEASPAWTLLTQVLTDLGRDSQRVGTLLCAQTGAQPAASLARLIAALPPGTLGADLCPGLLLVNGHSPSAAVEALGTNIYTVHAQDGVQGFGQSRGHLCELGDGAADWPNLLGMLQERDYRGDFFLDQTPSGDPEWELERGLKYLQGL